ncbi:hypothetical protein [Phenylobacterium aquaticum]|uniref:hypothetical protein n=1 Tax=Phenylobacterium aquaticum TaxID=1763816 RepID=UPI001F5C9DEA|nr:hypothetical protein [Phenylobacterium aquaticum]MCI3134865.1 hypothetical protein [Phenylobacterium aquaticum]
MSRVRLALALLLLMTAGRAQAANPLIEMSTDIQRKLGLATQPLAAAHHAAALSGFARVLDPGPLAILDSDIAQAAAMAQASQAEAARSRGLAAEDATVSTRAAEAATAQARADASKLALLRRRLGLEWGPAFMSLSDARRGDLVGQLAAGVAALVRVDAGAGLGGAKSVRLDLGGGRSAAVRVLGPARAADPRLLSSGLIGLVTGPQASELGVGLTVPALIATGGGGEGVLIPRAALIRSGGATFAYVRKDATHFERRTITGTATDPAGLFAAGGLKPGEAVVVAGAAALHAAETPRAAAADTDEDK